MSGFTVDVTREDDLWVAVAMDANGNRIGALDFVDFDDVHETMPEYIADMSGFDPNDVAVDWHYEIDGRDVTNEIRTLRAAAAEQHEAEAKAKRARDVALSAMASAGLSQRTIADVVHLSHQCVNQLLKTS